MEQTVIDGRYVLLEPVGGGGTARVYRARDEVLGREVALKMLRERYAGEEEFVERFRREAQGAAGLSHANIVSVYDRGVSAEGDCYVVMEYVPGGTLKERLEKRGTLRPRTAAAVAAQVSGALEVSHERGIIHRDLKPANVLVTEYGDVKVADFGSAEPSGTGLSTCTVAYMSPEQARGGEVGPASDLYSLGVVLYEMLTGEMPFSGESQISVALMHVSEPPRPPSEITPGIPEDMEALVLKLLSKSPGDRYTDAQQLTTDLERLRDGEPPVHAAHAAAARPETPRNAGSARRRRLLPVALAVLLLVGLAGWGLLGAPGVREAPVADLVAGVESVQLPDGGGEAAGDGDPAESVFVHRATPENVSGNSTYLEDPVADGNPEAVVSVTQNWNPDGGTGIYNDRPVGVWYDAEAARWAIFNQDRAEMPEGAAFNVVVSEGPAEAES